MNTPSNNDDSLLQLAFSIAPRLDDPDENDDAIITNEDKFPKIDKDDDEQASENKVADVFSKQVPVDAFDPNAVDSDIASQMAKLSVTDREQVYMDVHGVSGEYVKEETPELIHLSLLDFQDEIELLEDKRAYEIAERLNPEYVHNQDFRLMFLRCDRFDCAKAALRMIRHFHMKLDLFGMDKLVTDITQDDFDVDDMDVLFSCTGRFLATKDRAGRAVNLIHAVSRKYKTDAILRKGFYNTMVAFRDNVELQRRGAVSISFLAKKGIGIGGGNPDLLWKFPKLNEGSPMRIVAVHWCWSDEVWEEQQALLKAAFSDSMKVRFRVHRGTMQENLEKLRGHGIDPTSIPINDKGELTDLPEEIENIEKQRLWERLHCPPRKVIHVPFSQDVLVGKGTPIQNHSGNKRLRKLIASHIKQYDKSQRGEKKAIALEIMATIRQRGGLFLKQNPGSSTWTPVNDDVARLKVTAAFRTYRQSLK